jgi:hypothetical protein
MGAGVGTANSVSTAAARFSRVFARDSMATELFNGCPVVTAIGSRIGEVDALLIDRRTHRLRYVIVNPEAGNDASVMIPWQSLYFDSALGRLVFYTYS